MAVSPVIAYKLRAAAVSLAIFLVFAGVLALLVARYWYPDYLFSMDGGQQGLRLVLAVDFVLGPVLALVFFHPEKSRPKLVFDIVVIAAIQVGAMGWGAWQVWSQRPVAVVYGSHRFIAVAPDIMRRQGESAVSLQRFSGQHPPLVYRRAPANEKEQGRQAILLMRYGFHYESQVFLFTPFRQHLGEVFARQAAMEEWMRKDMPDEWRARMEAVPPAQRPRLAFFEGRYANALLLFTPAGAYAGFIPMGDAPLPDL